MTKKTDKSLPTLNSDLARLSNFFEQSLGDTETFGKEETLDVQREEIKTTTADEHIEVQTSASKTILKNHDGSRLWMIFFLTLNASIGFFFYGYGLGIYNITKQNMIYNLNLDPANKNQIFSIISALFDVGAALGALIGGKVSYKFGRRKYFILLDVIGMVGCLICSIRSIYALAIGRIITGFVAGSFTVLTGIYIHEYVPTNLAGLCGGFYNIIGGIGTLLVFALGFMLPPTGTYDAYWWCLMFSFFPVIALVINFFLMLFVFTLDTPKILVFKNKLQDARQALNYVYNNNNDIDSKINYFTELKDKEVKKKEPTYGEVFCSQKYKRQTFIHAIINFFRQVCLMNVMITFSNLIFQKEFSQHISTTYTVYTGVALLLAIIISGYLNTITGRRTLIVGGFFTTGLTLLAIGIVYCINLVYPQVYLIIILVFVIGLTIKPVVWISNGEVLTDKGNGICAGLNWSGSCLMNAIFVYLLDSSLGYSGTFFMLSGISFSIFIMTFLLLKESKDKSEKEIENMYSTWLAI